MLGCGEGVGRGVDVGPRGGVGAGAVIASPADGAAGSSSTGLVGGAVGGGVRSMVALARGVASDAGAFVSPVSDSVQPAIIVAANVQHKSITSNVVDRADKDENYGR